MKRSTIGFFTLAGISAYLYMTGLIHSTSMGSPASVILAIAVLLLAAGYRLEWHTAANAESRPLSISDAKIMISVVSGALASRLFNVTFGLGAVLGAGIVGVLAALLLPDLSAAIYCGAFCGMASTKVLPSIAHLMLASTIAGIVFVLAKDTMNGFGGKLGATAAVGCTAATLITGNKMLEASFPDWDTGRYAVLVSVLASQAAYFISTRLKRGAVLGSGITSIAGGLLLPMLFPEIGSTLASACACGSYAGMSSRDRIPNEWLMAAAGAVAGLMFIWGSRCIGGIGGRLGTIGLGGVIATWSAVRLYQMFAAKHAEKQER